MKKANFSTPEEFHNRLSTYFNAAVALPLLPFVWLFLEIKNDDYDGILEDSTLERIIGYIVVVAAGLLVTFAFNRMKSVQINSQDNLMEKLNRLLHLKKQFYLIVFIASGIMAIGLWVAAAGVIIIGYVILLFFLTFQMPAPKKYVKELRLDGDEKDIILHKKTHKF